MADEVRVSSMEYRVWGGADTGGGWQPQVAGLSDSGIDSVICHRRSHLPGGVARS